MFGKLLKYEFKAVGKWYLGLYATAILLSVIIGLWLQSFIQRSETSLSGNVDGTTLSNTIEGVILTVTLIGFAIIIVGLFLSTLFLIVNRFRKNVYGRQGYLTMTLPVTNHQIILSKLTAGFVWSILSSITAMLGILIVLLFTVSPEMSEHIREISHVITEAYQDLTFINFGLYYIIMLIVDTIKSVLLIYCAISLGQLFKDHRTLLAVVFYFAIKFAESIFSFGLLLSMEQYAGSYIYSTLTLSLSILLSIGYYFSTYYIMNNKLNLQ
ncbi:MULTISPECIES: hypothetical protein [unclassified Streptococcus]|uniref:hypothetical protein n=1 Tax=unclassified Streptococcus TaxID=2608887 RepID=UPI00107210F9|nr:MULTISPECIES: hypothetical protein [unclassified Streptococcus]MBF0786464.1 hypothetical protein [Streptococcus sp. 19428wC2_LYSM12]MCQ9212420.1 hypothetical protein [Streptococcus sp. B01]MCQ9213758.1 hypothetical protein [Streptococcus sp. O1]TFV06629.1 hypothetical protein E4T79_00745 [Streptococcus sp. LYSM12]